MTKTAQCNPSTGVCTFTVTVVNNGPGPYNGGVSFDDFITPTVPFTMTAFGGGGPSGAICYTSGSLIQCSQHYPSTLPSGGTYGVTLVVQVGATGTFQNCVAIPLTDTNPANNQACVPFGVSPNSAFDLSVQKTVQCPSGQTYCMVTITVTNVGVGVYSGPLTVTDPANPSWPTLLAGGGFVMSLGTGSCALNQGSGSVICQGGNVNLAPGQGTTFQFYAYFPGGLTQAFQNCAILPSGVDSNPSNDQSCVGVSPTASTPAPTATPASAGVDLAVTKTAQSAAGPCPDWPHHCYFAIKVTNVGSGVYSGPLTVTDQANPSWPTLLAGGGSVTGACSLSSGNVICSAGNVTLAPGQSQTFNFTVSFGPGGAPSASFQNCASLPSGVDGNPSNNQSCIGAP